MWMPIGTIGHVSESVRRGKSLTIELLRGAQTGRRVLDNRAERPIISFILFRRGNASCLPKLLDPAGFGNGLRNRRPPTGHIDWSLQDCGMGTPSPAKAIPTTTAATAASVSDEALAWLGIVIVTLGADGTCRSLRGPAAQLGLDPAAIRGRTLAELLTEVPDSPTFALSLNGRSLQAWRAGGEVWLRDDARAPLVDFAGQVRRICHDLNNTILALRCVCDGVTMATGSTIVRADDLIEEVASALRTLSTSSRAVFGLEAPPANPEAS